MERSLSISAQSTIETGEVIKSFKIRNRHKNSGVAEPEIDGRKFSGYRSYAEVAGNPRKIKINQAT